MAVPKQHQPKDPPINDEASRKPAISARTTTTKAEEINVASKRQRRPSVRLVEIGDQPAAALSKQWKSINRVSKTRPLTNIGVLDEGKEEKAERGDLNSDNLAIGSWKIKGCKPKKDLKRPRTNWLSNRIDDEDEGLGEGGSGSGNDNDNVDKDGNDFSRGFVMEVSESSLKEQNPVHDSLDDERDLQFKAPHSTREKIVDDGVDFDGVGDNGGQNSARRLGGKLDGVRVWLDGLGLGRYWPVFEFHEVDEGVLPLLTLDDLKDMGINAVGSRRKMYCAIQKLHERLS